MPSEFECRFCPEVFDRSGILHRHETWEHPEEFAAAEREAAEARAAEEAARAEEGRYTPDGFLRRTGGRREPIDYLGSVLPNPEQPLPPWEREEQERRGP